GFSTVGSITRPSWQAGSVLGWTGRGGCRASVWPVVSTRRAPRRPPRGVVSAGTDPLVGRPGRRRRHRRRRGRRRLAHPAARLPRAELEPRRTGVPLAGRADARGAAHRVRRRVPRAPPSLAGGVERGTLLHPVPDGMAGGHPPRHA